MLASSAVERAGRVAELAAADAVAIHSSGRLTEGVLAAIVDANLFRLGAPGWVGGDDVDVGVFVHVLDVLGRADMSTAWCVGQANASSRSIGARLDPGVGEAVFASPFTAVAAGFPTGPVRADRVDGGYRVSGRWAFASGCPHCDWFDARALVFDGGVPVTTGGIGEFRSILVPRSQVACHDSWEVAGMRGTGSHSYSVDEFVSESHTVTLFGEAPSQLPPAYQLPVMTYIHAGFAALVLGGASSALNDVLQVVSDGKLPALSQVALRETTDAQRTIARCRSMARAASSHLDWACERVVAACVGPGLSMEDRGELRLAITSGFETAVAVVDELYRLAGTSGIFAASPLQRRFQDVHVAAQQVVGRRSNFDNVGRFLLGLPYDTVIF